MKDEFYEAGCEDALTDCFQKEAFGPALGAAARQGWKHLAGRVAPLFGAQAGKAVGQAAAKEPGLISRGLSATEQGVSGGVRKVLGDRAGDVTQKAIQGVPREMFQQAAGGAAIMGGLEGTIGAATADPGDRLEAFGKGLTHGAASGAAFGGVAGLGGGLMRNARRGVAHRMAQRAGYDQLPGYSAQGAAEQQMQRGFFGNLKDIKTQQGPIGRGASTLDAAGRVGQIGAEWILPGMVLPASLAGTAEEMPPAQDQNAQAVRELSQDPTRPLTSEEQDLLQHYLAASPHLLSKRGSAEIKDYPVSPGYAGAVAGGLPAGIGLGYLMKHLSSTGKIPNTPLGNLVQVATPALGAAASGITGSIIGSKLFPPKKDPELEKLHEVDFNKLLRYYKKQGE